MILETNTVQVSSSGIKRSGAMGISEDALIHVMTVLENLYSDPLAAVARELATNAYDSHLEAGIPERPIEISIPDRFEQSYTVRDYGIGLSEDQVYAIYGQYGASTKRGSNEFNGQLGFGCKSPFSITNQFSLTTVKDGEKCFFSIHKDENGAGQLSMLEKISTDEVDGVEVKVPVESYRDFNEKLYETLKFMPMLPTIVNATKQIKRPEYTYELPEIGIRFYAYTYNSTVSNLVMGGVAYPLSDDEFKVPFNFSTSGIEITANIGDVNFSPNRESLRYNDKTKAFITAKLKQLTDLIDERGKSVVLGKNNYTEAYQAIENDTALKMAKSLGIMPVIMFNGINLTTTFSVRGNSFTYDGSRMTNDGRSDIKFLKSKIVLIPQLFDTDKLTTRTRNALKSLMAHGTIYLVTEDKATMFLPGDTLTLSQVLADYALISKPRVVPNVVTGLSIYDGGAVINGARNITKTFTRLTKNTMPAVGTTLVYLTFNSAKTGFSNMLSRDYRYIADIIRNFPQEVYLVTDSNKLSVLSQTYTMVDFDVAVKDWITNTMLQDPKYAAMRLKRSSQYTGIPNIFLHNSENIKKHVTHPVAVEIMSLISIKDQYVSSSWMSSLDTTYFPLGHADLPQHVKDYISSKSMIHFLSHSNMHSMKPVYDYLNS